MPDRRRHRGAHPDDAPLFAPERLPVLRRAVEELGWLLSRGYAEKAALKLVGDHHSLLQRQRHALQRCACSDASLDRRRALRLPLEDLRGRTLGIDGFNLLTTLETAFSGGVVLVGRDDCLRDISGVHGTWRRVTETVSALEAAARVLSALQPASCVFCLDRPVSNSGRLAAIIEDLARVRGWPWSAEVTSDADRLLIESGDTVASADGFVIERAASWVNLAREVVAQAIPTAHVVDLRPTTT